MSNHALPFGADPCPPAPHQRRHLLGLIGASRAQLDQLLSLSRGYEAGQQRAVKRAPSLRGRTIINLFLSPSTRTRAGFELAAQRLGADVVSVGTADPEESLLTLAHGLEALRPDVLVLRHPHAGAAHFLAQHIDAGVVNAGDGLREHPTQALAESLTLLHYFEGLEGRKIVVLGDALGSRVVRSTLVALTLLGADVVVCAPPTLLPSQLSAFCCETTHDPDQALRGASAVLLLPLARAHQDGQSLGDGADYHRFFGLTSARLKWARPDCRLLHSGPLRRTLDLEPGLTERLREAAHVQAHFALAARMAALYFASGGALRIG